MSDAGECTLVSLPGDLVADVDRLVGRAERERFIAEAVRRAVRRLRSEAIARMAGAARDAEIAEWDDSDATLAWVRQQRAEADQVREHRESS
ncbi:MAG: hypothetical protein U0531_19000 [Dehalococcoidia bacterium]